MASNKSKHLEKHESMGPTLLTGAMSRVSVTDEHGNKWQYHSRSNQHTKVAAYAMLLDLLVDCRELRDQVARGLVGYALNQQLVGDKRTKTVDLVLGRPAPTGVRGRARDDFAEALRREVELEEPELRLLGSLPSLHRCDVGQLLVAFEIKAAMTEHGKALPRLFDELDATQAIIHQAEAKAIAIGLVIVNASERFVSPDLNRHDHSLMPAKVTRHTQPSAAARVFQKVRELPLAGISPGGEGYEALGFVTVECQNDGTPTDLVVGTPSPLPGDPYHYDSLIGRASRAYSKRFGNL